MQNDLPSIELINKIELKKTLASLSKLEQEGEGILRKEIIKESGILLSKIKSK